MKPGPPRLQKTADGKHREKGCVQLISPFVEKKHRSELFNMQWSETFA